MDQPQQTTGLDRHWYDNYPKLAKAFASMPERFPYALAEKHVRLMDNLESVWGTRKCIEFLDGLMLTDRPGRQGFSLPVMSDLMVLKEVHETLYPALSFNANDPFSTMIFDVAAREPGKGAAVVKSGSALDRRPLPKLASGPSSVTRQPERPPATEAPAGAQASPNQATSVAEAAEALERWPMLSELSQFHQIIEKRRQGETAPPRDKRKLLEILKTACHLEEKQLAAALKAHLGSGKKEPLGKFLVEMGVVSDEDVIRALCLQNGIPLVDLRKMVIPAETMKKVPVEVARVKRVVPVAVVGNVLFLAVENPFAFGDREYFSFLTNLSIELVMASRNHITLRLADYGQARTAKEADEAFRDLAQKALVPMASVGAASDEEEPKSVISTEDATVVGLVNKMILDAADHGASDIHIERFPGVPNVQIRFRRDGLLEPYSEYPAAYHDAVVSRIKIIANLDITERRRPQDGKISFIRQGKERLDLRVATLPTIRNIENVVIRLLAGGEPLPIAEIGLSERDYAAFRQMIGRTYGLILVCGPTGSGKTTTLHSVLKELNTPERKIWTIEDPVEIIQRNINQMQVNAKIGLTFAAALRSFLRADPDIIMVGEMRDEETAKTALEASMTGHLVLSTLHTNTAAETVARMLDLGADPFNLSDALVGIIAQRLTRRICAQCKERQMLTTEEVHDLATEFFYSAHQRNPSALERDRILDDWLKRFGTDGNLALWRGRGCEACNGKGYKGRLPIFEVLVINQDIRHLVRTRAPAGELLQAAIASGMYTLKQDGIEKALSGLTDITEVRGVCN